MPKSSKKTTISKGESKKRKSKGRPKKEKKTKEPKEKIVKKAVKEPAPKREKYYEAVGRRKTAVARIRIFTRGEKNILVNDKPYENYFPTLELQQIVQAPLGRMKCLERFRILAKVRGGGLHAQAEAIKHGIARALVIFNPDFRKRLQRGGFLTRDSRMRERKKFGLKRARKAPQWQKR